MTIQVTNFSIITGNDINSIPYSFNVLDDSGAIQKANIKRSLPLNADTVLPVAVYTANILDIAEAIKAYLISNTTI